MSTHLDATVTATTQLESITISDSHTNPTSTAIITAGSTGLGIGDAVTVHLGITGNKPRLFEGYVKSVESKEAPGERIITCANKMIRAVDFFIAASDPDSPLTYDHIKAEDLIQDLMKQCGLNSFDGQSSDFTFGIDNSFEVNLTSVYDYSKFIADIIAYSVWCDDDGTVHFRYRPPFVNGETPVATLNTSNILTIDYNESDKDLRNRVVVYGAGGIHAEAQASSPYLPAGFYKSMVVSAPTVIDTQGMADKSANYNLPLVNKLTKSGQVVLIGNPGIVCRDVVTVNMSAVGMTGDWYVYSIQQSWSKDGFTTSLELRA